MLKHRTFIFLVASLLVALIVSSAVAQVRGIVPVPIKDKSGNQVGLYKGSYALVIGVSDYRGQWPSLRGVREDVREVSGTLSLQGFKVILVENPSYREMLSGLNNFISDYGLDSQNRLLFYFAGHGYTHKPSYASNDPEEWMGYFLASNSPDPKSNYGDFLANSLSMKRMEELALKIEAKHALFVFDSCFSGSIFSVERAIPYDIEDRTVKPVRQFITAGSADETVPDKSIFRRQFVSGVDGEADRNRDGYVTGSELGMFLEETVINLSRRTQTPQYGKLRHRRLNKGDFVFSLLATGSIANSTAKVIKERELIEQDRSKIKQERLAAINRLALEKQQLEQEKQSLNEEKERAAKVQITNEIERIVRERKRLLAEKERLAEIQPTGKTVQTFDQVDELFEKGTGKNLIKKYPPAKKKVFKLADGKFIKELEAMFQLNELNNPLPLSGRDEPISINTKEKKYVSYFGRVKKQVNQVWTYPTQEIGRNIGGSVVIRFEISKDGNLIRVRLVNTSGYDSFDKNAIEAVKNAAPYPPFPRTFSKNKLSIETTFVYNPPDSSQRK